MKRNVLVLSSLILAEAVDVQVTADGSTHVIAPSPAETFAAFVEAEDAAATKDHEPAHAGGALATRALAYADTKADGMKKFITTVVRAYESSKSSMNTQTTNANANVAGGGNLAGTIQTCNTASGQAITLAGNSAINLQKTAAGKSALADTCNALITGGSQVIGYVLTESENAAHLAKDKNDLTKTNLAAAGADVTAAQQQADHLAEKNRKLGEIKWGLAALDDFVKQIDDASKNLPESR